MADRYDVIVTGAGPAGLGAALYTGRSMLSTLVLERLVVGGQLIVAADVDNYLGFHEGIMGPDLVDRMKAHAERFGAEIRSDDVTDITADGALKTVVTKSARYTAPIVIVASGATHRKLGVPGEEELSGRGVSYCATCDGPFFRGKKLVVVGGGDAAMTEGIFLTRFASEIKLIHRRQGFRARPLHIEELRNHEKVDFVLDTAITRVNGEGKVEGVSIRNVQTGGEGQIDCDGVFVFIGHDPNTGFLKTLLPEHAGGVIPTDMNMETDVKGLYAVGDVRKGSYRQIATAVADGVVAAMHAEHRIKSLLGAD